MELTLHFSMNVIPEVARRGHHALILLQNGKGEFLLGEKKFYPEGISRMVGGGMDPDEVPYKAAQRELEEETGLTASIDALYSLATITAQILEESSGEDVTFVTHLFYYNTGNQILTPSDDIDGISTLTESEYLELIERYKKLSKKIDPQRGFAWYDYGQLYSQIHQIALDASKDVQ